MRNRWFLLVAAIFASILVIAVSLVTFKSPKPMSTSKKIAVLPITTINSQNQLYMFSDTTGWATTPEKIVHTTDGGEHWSSVFEFPQGGIGRFNFRSGTIASFILNNDTSQSIYHTGDGGKTWQHSDIDAGGLYSVIQFLDEKNGWFANTKNISDNSSSQIQNKLQQTIWRTVDGGASWQKLLTNISNNGQGTLFDFITFATSLSGWAMDDRNKTIYRTTDGGQTWNPLNASFSPALPPSTSTQQFQLFTPQDGTLHVSEITPTGVIDSVTLYSTKDGGQTWQATGTISDNLQQNSLSFAIRTDSHYIDVQNLWYQSNSSLNRIQMSNDGGQHWTPVKMQSNFKHIDIISFISTRAGWAYGYNETVTGSTGNLLLIPPFALLKTTDGGHSWQEIAQNTGE